MKLIKKVLGALMCLVFIMQSKNTRDFSREMN